MTDGPENNPRLAARATGSAPAGPGALRAVPAGIEGRDECPSHVTALADGGDPFALGNLQSLCAKLPSRGCPRPT